MATNIRSAGVKCKSDHRSPQELVSPLSKVNRQDCDRRLDEDNNSVSSESDGENETIIRDTENKESGNLTRNDDGYIEDPVLAYILSGLQTGTIENVRNATVGFFTPEKIKISKRKLWNEALAISDVIGNWQTRKASSVRSEEANVMDIISAFRKLDKCGKTPTIVISALRLHEIPRSPPEDLNNISMVDRILDLECKVNNMKEQLSKNILNVEKLNDKVSETPITYAKAVVTEPTQSRQEMSFSSIYSMNTAAAVTSVNGSTRSRGGRGGRGATVSRRPLPPAVNNLRRAESTTSIRSDTSQQSTEDGFSLPTQEKKKARRAERRRQRFITGSGMTQSRIKGAPEPARDLFIFRLENCVTCKDLMDFIESLNCKVRELRCVSNENVRLTVGKSDYEKLYDDQIWPEGVRIRKYIPARPKDTDRNDDDK
jgi:hypothetical protein